MDGIFYSDNNTLNELLHKYVPVSAALSDEQIEPSLNSACQLFLLPVLGTQVIEHLCVAAADDDASSVETMALDEARCAVANLALWFNFNELNSHLTDQGWKREEGDTYKSLYHYQEIELKETYRNKGYNAIDRLLNLLQSGISSFPEYEESPAYIAFDKALVKGPADVEKFFSINGSYLVFLALQPHINIVQTNELQTLIGTKLYDMLIAFLDDAEKNDREDFSKYEGLRRYCSAYVALLALSRHMTFVGTITDRGAYFSSQMNSEKSAIKVVPVGEEERMRVAAMLRKDASRIQGRLICFIEKEFPNEFIGRPGDAFKRNNDCKPTFWT